MFFDTGEDEMPESFGLPRMVLTSDLWLTEYLRTNCAGGESNTSAAIVPSTPPVCRRAGRSSP
ncbi:hypothetical protein [Streptomyces sp. NPDC002402]